MIQRFFKDLERFVQPGKVLVVYGPRRVGKTTLIQQYLLDTAWKYKLDSGDNIRVQQLLSSQDFDTILGYIEGYELLVIDEAQQIPNIGMALKIIVDQRPDIRVVVTGSSSFELSNQIGEPLTGRKQTITLYPIAQLELLNKLNAYDLSEGLENYLVFGSYPEVLTKNTDSEKRDILNELAYSYALKDVLALERVKASRYLLDLLKLLAFQIGKEVSFQELARQLGLSVKTVQRYLDLLEKAFVIIRVGGFGRNLRSEVVRTNKYYFYDTGLRNAIINQFHSLKDRSDVGQLWENFLFIERLKKRSYEKNYGTTYFWRTYSGQEIDLIEDGENGLSAFEFKWSKTKSVQVPSAWNKTYPSTPFSVINPKNYLDFIT